MVIAEKNNWTILILEDDQDRLERFHRILGDKFTVVYWRDAHTMTNELLEHLESVDLISLDHDLYTDNLSDPDPGDGLTVAKFIADQEPLCPIIIHSTNSEGAKRMQGELEFGGWKVKWVKPIGEDWIETTWIHFVKKLIN